MLLLNDSLSPVRVAAKYQKKKKVKSQDGGETTIYEYGPRQVANRHKEKAERIQKFMPKLPDLRAAYVKALKDKDPMKRLVALAVGLIDHTYERVGNVDSAEDNGHYGVTVWEVRHVKFKGGKAEISYTGKSGVKHSKTVDDAKLVSALKEAVKGKKPEDRILCEGDECVVNASDVNDYLEPYGITAKDLRGLHANDEVRKALKEIRSDGPELPRDRKEKDKILKDEFKKAIEQAAEAVGHEASTLRSQYLAPVIEKSYLHDGTVPDRLDKKAGATVLVGGDGESKAWVQGFFRRHPRYPAWARLVEYALATVKTATLDESEKEEREDKRLIQKDTKFKPPRQDLRRRDVEDRDTRGDDDPDEKQDEKDRSKNYKDASLIQRVASRYMSVRVVRLASDAELRQEFLEEHGDKEYTSPTTGNKVNLRTLSSREGKDNELFQEEFKKYKESQGGVSKKRLEELRKSLESELRKSLESKENEEGGDAEDEKADPSEALAGLADAIKSGSGKKTEEARKKLIAEHPELKDAIKEQFDKYYAATKGLAEAIKTSNPDSISAAEAKVNAAIEDFRNMGKAKPEESKPEEAKPEEAKPEEAKPELTDEQKAAEKEEAERKEAEKKEADRQKEAKAAFNDLAKTFKTYEQTQLLQGVHEDKRVDFIENVNAHVQELKEWSKDVTPNKLAELFSEADKTISEQSESDRPDLSELAEAFAILQFQNEKLKGRSSQDVQKASEKIFAESEFENPEVSNAIKGMPLYSQHVFNQEIKKYLGGADQEAAKALQDKSSAKDFEQKVAKAKNFFSKETSKKRNVTDPNEAAQHAAILVAHHKANDPMVRFSVSEDNRPSTESPEDQAVSNDRFANKTYQDLVNNKVSVQSAKEYADRLYKQSQSLPEGTVARDRALSAYNAIRIYQIAKTKPNEDVEGVVPYVANAIRAAARSGLERSFLETAGDVGKTSAESFQRLADKAAVAYNNLTDSELTEFLPEKDPLGEIFKSASANSPAASKFLRGEVMNVLVAQFRFNEVEHSDFSPELDQSRDELHENLRSITSNKRWFSDNKTLGKIKDSVADFLKRMAAIWDKAKKATQQKASGFLTPRPSPPRVASLYIRNSGNSFICGSY
jgi:DNA topoisomerase IB